LGGGRFDSVACPLDRMELYMNGAAIETVWANRSHGAFYRRPLVARREPSAAQSEISPVHDPPSPGRRVLEQRAKEANQ